MLIESFTQFVAQAKLSADEISRWIASQKTIQSAQNQILDTTKYNQHSQHVDGLTHNNKDHSDTPTHNNKNHSDTATHNNKSHSDVTGHNNKEHTDKMVHNNATHANWHRDVPHSDFVHSNEVHTQNNDNHKNTTHTDEPEHIDVMRPSGHHNVGSGHKNSPGYSQSTHLDSTAHSNQHNQSNHMDLHSDKHSDTDIHSNGSHTDTSTHSNNDHSDTSDHSNANHSDTETHNNTNHSNIDNHGNNTPHTDTGFDHSNYIPIKPAILNIEANQETRDTFDVGFYSYDKNIDGTGTQDAQSKTVKYVIKIRQIRDKAGNSKVSDWVTYINGGTANSFSFKSVDPLKTGNTDPKATEGVYELEAYSYNDAISIKGISKTYISPKTNIVFSIIQNKDPIVTITNGSDFIGHTFGLTGTMLGGAYYRYEDKYPTASVAQKKGVFIDLKINDPDAEDYHKVEAYLSNSDGSVKETAIVNGVVSGSGTNKNAKAFIPLDYFDDINTHKEYYVTVRVTDYKDAGLTKLAGSVITTQKISPSGLNMRFFADVIVPSVTFDTPSDFWNEELKIQANLTDMQSGINGVYYQVFADGDAYNNSNWKYISGVGSYSSKVATSSPTFTLKGEGKFRLAIKLIDNGGNTIIKISSPYKVGVGNQKPIAVFNPLHYQLNDGQVPDKTIPIPADETVYYNEYSKDPEGLPFTQRYWTVKNLETGVQKIFVDKEPYSTFETSGMGLYGDGVGTYEITLKVKDKSPDGFATELWSDPVTKTLVIDHPLKILGLSLEQIVSPPQQINLPVQMPVSSAIKINTGYKLVYETATKAANTVTLKFYANGRPLGVYSSSNSIPVTAITQTGTGKGIANHRFEFYLDKKLPIGTIIDIKVEITKVSSDGSTKVIVDSSLGSQCMVVKGSSEQDVSINRVQ